MFDQLWSDGHSAYRQSHYREAALLFARAKEAARQFGNPAQAFKAGFWEAHSREMLGEYKQAYALLFKLLASAGEDVPCYERWCAEMGCYQLWMGLGKRTYQERQERLARLEDYANQHPNTPAGDLPELRAQLLASSAQWSEALTQWEEAWTRYDGSGYVKSEKAQGAIQACLRLGHSTEAQRWLSLLAETEQDRAYGVQSLHGCQALCALEGDGRAKELEPIAQNLEDDLASSDSDDNAFFRYVLARIYLLIRPQQSPYDRFHPARAALRRRPEDGRSWERALVLVDYHLAALRFLLGMAPCDDYYYRHPSLLPERWNTVAESALQPCLHRLNVALHQAQRKAERLDQLNETTWYGSEVHARKERRDLMLSAYTGEQINSATR